MFHVTELKKTCDACPAQWEGRTEDGRGVYIRYRWGVLSAYVQMDGDADALDSPEVLCRELGGEFGGTMNLEQLRRHIGAVMSLPERDE